MSAEASLPGVSESESAGGLRSRRWWWLAIPVAIGAFALAYGITRLVSDDNSGGTPAAPQGISFGEAHQVPLHITERQLAQRIQVPPARTFHRNKKPAGTCRLYPLTDEVGRYIFCFSKGKLVLAYGGPTG